MYIFSQDMESIVNFDGFSQISVSKLLPGAKERHFSLTASNGVSGPWTLGYYPTEAAAKAELERLAAALRSGEHVFDVR